MTHEMNAMGQAPAGERRRLGWGRGVAPGGSAEFHVDGLGAIGFESACPALLGSVWSESGAEADDQVNLS